MKGRNSGMKVYIRMIRRDMLSNENEEEVLLETEALLNGNRLLYRESETARQSVVFGSQIILERHADVSSETVLIPGREGKSTVTSEYGTMELKTRLIDFYRTPQEWSVEYQVAAGREISLHQRLIWQISLKN